MFDIKTIVTALVVSLLVVFGGSLVGNQSGNELGAANRLVNSDFTMRDLAVKQTSLTSTSTVYVTSSSATQGGRVILEDSDGSGCSQVTVANGTVAGSTITCP
jgi:hypothetical protein